MSSLALAGKIMLSKARKLLVIGRDEMHSPTAFAWPSSGFMHQPTSLKMMDSEEI